MAGTMSLVDLVADLKSSLHDSAGVFDAGADADFVRFLNQALPDMGWKRPVTRLGQLTLVSGEANYPLSAYPDFYNYKTHLWAMQIARQPWEPGYPGAVSRVSCYKDGAGASLAFEPAPSAAHIAVRGSAFKFYYFARHVIGAAAVDTTVGAADRGLLLLRAQAEAAMEMILRNLSKPVAMRDGLSGTPRNSTPRALHDALLAAFVEAR
jgi:hypothetical protein